MKGGGTVTKSGREMSGTLTDTASCLLDLFATWWCPRHLAQALYNSFSTDSDMLSWHCMPLHLYFSFHPTSFSVSTWCLGCALSLIGFSLCVWSHTYSRYIHRSHGGWEAAQRIGIKLHKGQTRHERDEWHTLSPRMSAASRSEPGQWRRWGAYFSWAGPPTAPKPSAPLLSSSFPLHMRKTLVLRGKTTSAKAAVGPICVLQAGRRMQVPSSQISKPLKRLLNNMILIQVRLHHRPQLNSSQKNLNSSSGDTDSQPERLLLQRRLEQNQFGSILRCSPCQECWTLWHRPWTSSGTSIFSANSIRLSGT